MILTNFLFYLGKYIELETERNPSSERTACRFIKNNNKKIVSGSLDEGSEPDE